ncbi:unnamed protein product [Penicillium discolor]
MQGPHLENAPSPRPPLGFGSVEQRLLDASPPVRGRDEEIDLRGVRIGLLREGDGHHADDLISFAGDESEVQRIGVVLPVRQHLRGVRGELGETDLLVADLSVQGAVRAEVRGVRFVEGGRDDQRRDRPSCRREEEVPAVPAPVRGCTDGRRAGVAAVVIARSAHPALHVVHEEGVRLRGRAVTLLSDEEQVAGIDGPRPARTTGPLCPLEQPEADPEREAVRDAELAELVVAGDLEDLAVLGIGRMGGAA